jgi:hypothetical protein
MGWAPGSDLGWGRRPKLHGMQGVSIPTVRLPLPILPIPISWKVQLLERPSLVSGRTSRSDVHP